jgi:hypothetical protein
MATPEKAAKIKIEAIVSNFFSTNFRIGPPEFAICDW